MYCFSQICRVCLGSTTDSHHSHAFDYDKIKIREKLKFCVPEIVTDDLKLPDNVCNPCLLFLEQMYKFKHMCIENTNTLQNYASKMSSETNIKSNLSVSMNTKTEPVNDQNIVIQETKTSEGISMYSISLNQWDLFETKYTCRCIKEYGSFTEETTHLCKHCKGDLHGFRLSKIKVDRAQNRYNESLTPSQLESDDSSSNYANDATTDKKYERGFDYNDILLCKVHVNGVNKQINVLNSVTMVTKETETIDEIKAEYSSSVSPRKKGKYKCTLCDKSYTRKYNLHNHFSTHKDSRFYYCKICTNKFITEQELKEHEYIHRRHSIGAIKTEPSPKKIKLDHSLTTQQVPNQSDVDFNRHNFSLPEIKPDLNSSDENLICGTCDKVFDHKSNLAIHLMTHFGKKEFKCNECGKEFFREDNFIEHNKLHKVGRKYECNQCEKSYHHLSNLRRHQQSHGGHYLCSICNQKFTEKDVLEDHIFATHTKQKPPKIYNCTLCKATFNHIDQLKSHVLFTHPKSTVQKSTDKKKLFSCKYCKITFTHRADLEGHIMTHLKNKGKKGNSKSLKLKLKGGRQHCPICDRLFSIKTSMKKHLRTHSSGKIKNCKICKKEFTNMFLLREHIKTHYEYLNFKCHLCDKAYLSKANLTRHIDVSHNK